ALYTAASRRSVWWVIGSPGGGAAPWWGRPNGWVRSGRGGGLVLGAVRAEVAAVALAHPAVALGFASTLAGRAGGRHGGVVPWLAAAVAEDERAEEGGHGGLLAGWVGSAAGPGRYTRAGPPAITGRAQRTGRADRRGGRSTTGLPCGCGRSWRCPPWPGSRTGASRRTARCRAGCRSRTGRPRPGSRRARPRARGAPVRQ